MSACPSAIKEAAAASSLAALRLLAAQKIIGSTSRRGILNQRSARSAAMKEASRMSCVGGARPETSAMRQARAIMEYK